MKIDIESHGFRIQEDDYLIIINQVRKDRWLYDFYKSTSIDNNTQMEPACSPFEASGSPWITSRYKDSLFVNCMMKLLYSEKEETQKLVQKIITEIYKVSDEYVGNIENDDIPEEESVDKILMRYARDFELFHDTKKITYARIQREDHHEIYAINSEEFSDILRERYLDEYNSVVKKHELESVIETISAIAKFKGKEYEMYIRICEHDGAIWFDLGNWKAVKITKNGWEIIDNPPILFKKFPNQKSYDFVIEPNGNAKDIFSLVRLEHDKQQMLFLVDLISKFIPNIQHVATCISGDAGSGKSTKIIFQKRLVDWCENDFIRMSKNTEEIIQNMSHTYYAIFDNISYMTREQSDLLATAITGASGSRRVLYKQDSDFIYKFKICIGLTGIDVVVNRPDLIERSILFEEGKANEYMSENEIFEQFDKIKGSILGGIFNTISEAMKHRHKIRTSRETRMVDFIEWSCAISKSLGYTQEEFLEAYALSCSKLNNNLLDNNTISRIVLKFMEYRVEWEGNMEKLLTELRMTASLLGFDKYSSGFPSSPIILSRKYNEIKNNLEKRGITKIDTNKRERIFKLHNKNNSKQSLIEESVSHICTKCGKHIGKTYSLINDEIFCEKCEPILEEREDIHQTDEDILVNEFVKQQDKEAELADEWCHEIQIPDEIF